MIVESCVYALRRLENINVNPDDITLSFNDYIFKLTKEGYRAYRKIEDLILNRKLSHNLLASDDELAKIVSKFEKSGLIYKPNKDNNKTISPNIFFYSIISPLISKWIEEAFSHPFWDLMYEGNGNKKMYAGWLFELYHYTKNANRHMPLSIAYCRNKKIKHQLSKHYEEEWNHYHFFAKALRALGFTKEQVEISEPLPMTTEMSNFMRQAARENIIGYCVCSAILEGTTIDNNSYDTFYESIANHYNIPSEAIMPIYDHLELDKKYAHSNLFLDVCLGYGYISQKEANTAIKFGTQMAKHIWFWSENIYEYYKKSQNPIPRQYFNPFIE